MRHITFTFIGARDAQGMLHTLFYKLDSFDIYIYMPDISYVECIMKYENSIIKIFLVYYCSCLRQSKQLDRHKNCFRMTQ